MEHTKEPWTAKAEAVMINGVVLKYKTIADSKGVKINPTKATHDTLRAIACVNAMEGIEDPQALVDAVKIMVGHFRSEQDVSDEAAEVWEGIEAMLSQEKS